MWLTARPGQHICSILDSQQLPAEGVACQTGAGAAAESSVIRPRCDGADSKAWSIAQRDSLSFLDHGIGSAAAAAVITRRPAMPDLQTAPSWGSLARQTLAMYSEVRLSACFGSTESPLDRRRLRSPGKDNQTYVFLSALPLGGKRRPELAQRARPCQG